MSKHCSQHEICTSIYRCRSSLESCSTELLNPPAPGPRGCERSVAEKIRYLEYEFKFQDDIDNESTTQLMDPKRLFRTEQVTDVSETSTKREYLMFRTRRKCSKLSARSCYEPGQRKGIISNVILGTDIACTEPRSLSMQTNSGKIRYSIPLA